MKIIVLGATGMLGYEVFRTCLKRNINAHAIVRNKLLLSERLGSAIEDRINTIADVKDINAIESVISNVRPDYLINCVGIVKQSHLAEDYYESIAVNTFLPHQLQKLGEKYGCKLLHISTDCVFDGKKGFYNENDLPNAYDLYGKSKHLGEVGYGCGITLRTSIIGHEISPQIHGLIEWFLRQQNIVKGFTKAIFSGLTTLELTNVILDVVIPSQLVGGVYHVASKAISKYDLLKLTAEVYNKDIEILPSSELVIDRSLDGSIFQGLTGYTAPSWEAQIRAMKLDFADRF